MARRLRMSCSDQLLSSDKISPYEFNLKVLINSICILIHFKGISTPFMAFMTRRNLIRTSTFPATGQPHVFKDLFGEAAPNVNLTTIDCDATPHPGLPSRASGAGKSASCEPALLHRSAEGVGQRRNQSFSPMHSCSWQPFKKAFLRPLWAF